MTVKLVVLKTGENILADTKEGFLEDKFICYILEKPCTVTVNGTYKILDSEEDGGEKVSILFRQWPELSKDVVIELTADSICTIVEPQDEIKAMYEKQILGKKNEVNQDSGIDEQSNSDQSD